MQVGNWPVQFHLPCNPLMEEALREAQAVDLEGVPLRVVRQDYLGLLALLVVRGRDFTRILSLMESGSVNLGAFKLKKSRSPQGAADAPKEAIHPPRTVLPQPLLALTIVRYELVHLIPESIRVVALVPTAAGQTNACSVLKTEGVTHMKNGVKVIVQAVVYPLIILALVMAVAGRLSYWQGWVYAASNVLSLAANLLVLRNRPDLVAERLSPGEGIKWWDKVYFAVTTPLYLAAIAIAALDIGRFSWEPALPLWAYVPACIVYAVGQGIHLWAKGTNRWFATVVRIQKDRGQVVCEAGPYRYVRHPGYVGGILFSVATPLMLGSLLAVIPQAIAAGLLVVRTYLEDRTLQRELPGYSAYAGRVRYRLLPPW
jgi:protein-S-isoprenylcysteine O-methyltransferase Ste14